MCGSFHSLLGACRPKAILRDAAERTINSGRGNKELHSNQIARAVNHYGAETPAMRTGRTSDAYPRDAHVIKKT